MKFLVLCALVGLAAAQQQGSSNSRLQGQFVWDLLKPALTAGEVESLLASRDASYPTYADIPQTNFACGSRNGFYADIDTQCQVFHRCDLNGNQTSYLCVNTTVFNQITLICDAWYNVDCANSAQYESYANSRLYTDLPLFDTPPAGYLTPAQRAAEQVGGQQEQAQGTAGATQNQSQRGQPTRGNVRKARSATMMVQPTQQMNQQKATGVQQPTAQNGTVPTPPNKTLRRNI